MLLSENGDVNPQCTVISMETDGKPVGFGVPYRQPPYLTMDMSHLKITSCWKVPVVNLIRGTQCQQQSKTCQGWEGPKFGAPDSWSPRSIHCW